MPTAPTDADLADFLDESGWRASTLINACSVLRRWEAWLAARDVAVMAATHRDLKAYLAERDAANISAATRHKDWQVIRAVYAWAARSTKGDPDAKKGSPGSRPGAAILTADPMVRVPEPFVSSTPNVRFAAAADVAALEDHFAQLARLRRGGGETDRHRRNAAMVSMMFRSGCRVGDLPWIDLADLVRDDAGTIVACRLGGDDGSHTKTGKARIVPNQSQTVDNKGHLSTTRPLAPHTLTGPRCSQTAPPEPKEHRVTRLYTVDELADEHELSKDTIYDWLRAGDLVGFKLGTAWRIHPDDWEAFIARRRGVAS
jgi:excisionase family DNA binding protein